MSAHAKRQHALENNLPSQMLALEPRYLFDAAAVTTVVDVTSEPPPTDTSTTTSADDAGQQEAMAFEATVESATVKDQGFEINENLDVGAFAGQIKDAGGELPTGVTFTLINGQDSDAFLVSESGEITVKDNTRLDYENELLPPLPTVEDDGKQVPFLTFQVEVEVDVEVDVEAQAEVEVETNNGVAPATIDIFMLLRDVNDAPVATTPGNDTVFLGHTATVQISATDEDIHGDSDTDQLSWSKITYELDSPPAGASVNADGLFTWTPTEADTTTITVKVSNSFTGDLEQVVQFDVTAIELKDQGFEINENLNVGAFAGQIKDAGGELPAGVTFTLINGQDSDAFLVSESGEITVKDNTKLDYETDLLPTVEVGGKQVPFLTFQVEANNGVSPATIDIFMLLRDVNDAPEATTPGNTLVTLGQTATVQISATDEDIHGDSNTDQPSWSVITYELDSPPAGASINANGLFTWTPTEAGTTTITVKVSNSFTEDLEQVVQFDVTVNPSGGFNNATDTGSKPSEKSGDEGDEENGDENGDDDGDKNGDENGENTYSGDENGDDNGDENGDDNGDEGGDKGETGDFSKDYKAPGASDKSQPPPPDTPAETMKIMAEVIALVRCGNLP